MKRSIQYILSIHLLTLLVMSVCRVVHLLTNRPDAALDWGLLMRAMVIGVKFDNLIACYILALPLLLITLFSIVLSAKPFYVRCMNCLQRGVTIWYGILIGLVILISVANARYYHFFDNHLNFGVTEWFAFMGETTGMLLQDTTNWWFLLISILLVISYEWALVLVDKSFRNQWCMVPFSKTTFLSHVSVALLLYGLCFCGIRGSFQRYPLHLSFAYFSNSPFYNKLGINPIFHIIKTVDNRMKVPAVVSAYEKDVRMPYRKQDEQDGLKDYNVVVILMESMMADNLEKEYDGKPLTPYLRSLRDTALYFSNFYSAGIHTNNGITATMYGYGPCFQKATMRVPSDLFTGLPVTLHNHGYETFCFVTSNPQYDNMNSFLRDNGFEHLYSLYDYPMSEAVNNFGVPDDYLLQHGLEILEERDAEKPFLAMFLTVSNHSPVVVPPMYEDRGATDDERIIAYADHAIESFMTAARQTNWGKKTIFVLVADHGAPNGCMEHDMIYSYNRIPCFLIADGLPRQEYKSPGMQVDVFPTIMGLLGYEYVNTTMGIDLLRESRDCAYFVSNDHMGCSDGTMFYCYNIRTGMENLYSLTGEDVAYCQIDSLRAHTARYVATGIYAIEHGHPAPSNEYK